MHKVTSSDGTSITFDRLGDGPPVVVVGGQLCDRALTRPTAEELAKHFTMFNHDRRGRGDSGDTAPYAVEREIEDLEALIAEAGGRASAYAHSSGAGLALHAAAHGLSIDKLVLHEPPYTPDGAETLERLVYVPLRLGVLDHLASCRLPQGLVGEIVGGRPQTAGGATRSARTAASERAATRRFLLSPTVVWR
jgi:alpha-beta hydrolase superfamily lysophospholipase